MAARRAGNRTTIGRAADEAAAAEESPAKTVCSHSLPRILLKLPTPLSGTAGIPRPYDDPQRPRSRTDPNPVFPSKGKRRPPMYAVFRLSNCPVARSTEPALFQQRVLQLACAVFSAAALVLRFNSNFPAFAGGRPPA